MKLIHSSGLKLAAFLFGFAGQETLLLFSARGGISRISDALVIPPLIGIGLFAKKFRNVLELLLIYFLGCTAINICWVSSSVASKFSSFHQLHSPFSTKFGYVASALWHLLLLSVPACLMALIFMTAGLGIRINYERRQSKKK